MSRHFGEPSDMVASIALANSGPLQIELIQQRNDAPSMDRDFLAAGHEGLQHVAYWTKEFDRDFARLQEQGFVVGQSGEVGGPDGRMVYFDTEAHPGTVIELSEISGPKGKTFEMIAERARTWDGSNPICTIRT
ncbi:MAG: VOC family protein [Proteobacteria bacterium]|nr:VOC family protein [Pseudomonadota bacterium]